MACAAWTIQLATAMTVFCATSIHTRQPRIFTPHHHLCGFCITPCHSFRTTIIPPYHHVCGFHPPALLGVAADVYSSCIHKLLSRSSCAERVLWMLSVIYARLRYAADAAAVAGAASGMQGAGSVKQWNAPDKVGQLLHALAATALWCGILQSHHALAVIYCSSHSIVLPAKPGTACAAVHHNHVHVSRYYV